MFAFCIFPDWHLLTRTGSRCWIGARTPAASERQFRQIFPYQRRSRIVKIITITEITTETIYV